MDKLLLLVVFLPMLAAIPAYALGKRHLAHAYGLTIAVGAVQVLLCILIALAPTELCMDDPYVLGLGLHARSDGFRTIYAGVASFMWLMTGLMLPQYMAHGHKQPRYLFFTLLTQGATMGVFLSDDLITAFLFFEILSFTSYCWVIHEETPGAMRAGQTYLAISLLGGMAMLMGLMMLHGQFGTLRYSLMTELAAQMEPHQLYLPGGLILAGFGAKAGMFPLHVWLPKAHPVAPAPASALLSGVLTKVGVFGILVISTRLFRSDASWGNLLLTLGLINMLLGAVLALLSVDLKRTLACSSMSQIGFILVGVGLQSLLGTHDALAAQGTVLHMLNHSLIKLVLFMAAGVVYMNLHKLNLNDIRGYGRGRPLLMVSFLVGAASISGLPFFSGYASKTLLHESIVEYIVHLEHLEQSAIYYQIAEWVFIVSGGITFCYMLKLFVVLFVEKHPTQQKTYAQHGNAMTPLSRVALGGSALVLFLLGLYPEGVLTTLANWSLPFLDAHLPEHAVIYLAPVNLLGSAKSWAIGIALYFAVVHPLLRRRQADGTYQYINPWPAWLDMEERLYRPALKMLTTLGFFICTPLDLLLDKFLLPALMRLGGFVASTLNLQMNGRMWRVLSKATGAACNVLHNVVDAPAEVIALIFDRSRSIIPPSRRVAHTLYRGIRAIFDWLSDTHMRMQTSRRAVIQFIVNAYRRIESRFRQISFVLTLFAMALVVGFSIFITR